MLNTCALKVPLVFCGRFINPGRTFTAQWFRIENLGRLIDLSNLLPQWEKIWLNPLTAWLLP